ncbi:LOW QUALITY PROTEIN: hypothetical protein QYF61_017170 [Mycteria americana]|uniref:Uncharacterized protein n=1 Tax=Mycteria americana TaxID=33587 RepID=A0AAN7N9M1_MYCAM|nr:LOW QUALITY PROTEIN: hypothetical protein QYF61_017170 [Mycteria americana]
MPDNPFGEEFFPNIQSKPPLAQLEAISSCASACYLGEQTDPHLATASFQIVVESNKVSPQPPFLQAKQPQFPQPLLISLTLHHLCCPSLDTLQHLNVSLVVRGPKLNTVFEVRPHQCRVQRDNHVPSPLATLFLIQARMPLAFLATWAHCWLIFRRLLTNTPRPFSAGQLSSHSSPSLDGDSTTSLGSLFQCLTTRSVKNFFPNIQSKPPLPQLEAISSCASACYLGEQTDPHLATASFQIVVESNKVSPQPPFLQAKPPLFPQLLLIRLVLQTLHQLRCPSLDTLQHLNVSLVVRGPVFEAAPQTQYSRCGLTSAEYRGTITSLVLWPHYF